MKKLSIVLPAYNEEKNVSLSYLEISRILIEHQIPFELIYVNDGSTDNTWHEILTLKSSTCIGINFSRNFGKEAALQAGLKMATGDCVVVMDCDLQHSPDVLPIMYQKWLDGYEVVEGIKKSRGKESFSQSFFAKTFYKIMSLAIGIDMENSSDYKLLDRKVVDELNLLPERNRFFRALSFWVGYNQTTVEYEVKDRIAGETKWSKKSLFKYAINNIISFSSAPLQIVTLLGILYMIFAVGLSIRVLTQYFTGQALEGFTTVIILLLIVGGTILISLGIIGLYIGKIYQELKGRPTYIIKEVMTNEEN